MAKNKIICACIAAATAVSLAACGKTGSTSQTATATTTTTTTANAAAPTDSSTTDNSSQADNSNHTTDITTVQTPVIDDSAAVTTVQVTPLKAEDFCAFDGNTFKSEYFKCSLAFPAGWTVESSDTTVNDTNLICLLGNAASEDNAVLSKIEACKYSNEIETSTLIDSFEQTYSDIVASQTTDDPQSITNLVFKQVGDSTVGALNGKAFTISYDQREQHIIIYTVIYRLEDTKKDFLIMTFNYTDDAQVKLVNSILSGLQIMDITP